MYKYVVVYELAGMKAYFASENPVNLEWVYSADGAKLFSRMKADELAETLSRLDLFSTGSISVEQDPNPISVWEVIGDDTYSLWLSESKRSAYEFGLNNLDRLLKRFKRVDIYQRVLDSNLEREKVYEFI